MLPCPSSPPRGLPARKSDAPEIAAMHIGNAIVFRQPLIDESVIRRQQVQHAVISTQDAIQKQIRLAAKRVAQRLIEIGE